MPLILLRPIWMALTPLDADHSVATTDTDEANKLYQQSEEILLKELPAFPVYNANAYGVASKNVKSGFAMNWQNLPTYEKMSKK